jgi:hypothetical protein
MSTNRTQHLGAVGLTVTVGLLLVLAVQVGLTAAATGTSGASSSRALQGVVNIHLTGKGYGPGNPNPGRGRFTMYGAISDRGRFANDSHGEIGRGVRFLFGAKGTIRITVGHFGGWRITKGTKAYAGLRGRGTGGNLWEVAQAPIDIWMEGTVSM